MTPVRAAELKARFPLVEMTVTGVDWHSIQVIEHTQCADTLRRVVKEFGAINRDASDLKVFEVMVKDWMAGLKELADV